MVFGTDVFLSHNWRKDESGRDNHKRVSLINKWLKKRGYETWFDEEKMANNTVERQREKDTMVKMKRNCSW